MKQIELWYEQGLSYDDYLSTATEKQQRMHMRFLNEAGQGSLHIERLAQLKTEVKLLIFCDPYCNDCRITLSVMKQLSQGSEKLQFRIISREGNIEAMQGIFGSSKIPMVIWVQEKHFHLLYVEFPDEVKTMMKEQDDWQKETMIKRYRKGEFNEWIANQIMDGIVGIG